MADQMTNHSESGVTVREESFAPDGAVLEGPPEDEKRRRRREAEAARRGAEEAEAELGAAGESAARAALDSDLVAAESAGSELAEQRANWSPQELARAIELRAAEARTRYRERFAISTRPLAAWAARKLSESRTWLEEVRDVMRAEVARAQREYEGRLEFFEEKLLAWARSQPVERGTKAWRDGAEEPSSVRLPEAGVRLEVRDAVDGGVRVLDEEELAEELIEKVGLMELSDLGVVRQVYRLDLERAREFVLAHPGLQLRHAQVEPERPAKKLVIVRLAK